jgi:replicative DNA helicase
MTDHSQRVPPFSEDAEQAVLAAAFMDAAALLSALELIDDSMFYSERHRRIFRAMVAVVERGAVVDPITVSEQLGRIGELDAAGGKDYLGFLVDTLPTAENVAHHAAIIRDRSEQRRLIQLLQAKSDELWRGQIPTAALVQELLATLAPLAASHVGEGFVRVKDDLWAMIEDLEARAANPDLQSRYVVPTGYPEIDEPLGGGIQRGEMMVIAAVPGGCKSALAQNISLNVAIPHAGARAPMGAGYVSAEMKRRKVNYRNLAILGRIAYVAMRNARLIDHDYVRLAKAAGLLSNAPLWVDETPTPNCEDVIAKCRRLKAEHPELALVVVDFLQLVQRRLAADRRGKDANRALELTDIAYTLQGMGKELDVAVIATAQVDASDVETRPDKMPKAGDIRWSQGIREACDFLVTCYRPKMYEPDPIAEDRLEMMFWKARDAEPFRTSLRWQGQYLLLTSAPQRGATNA